jgi:hypothetical protein
MHCTPPQPPRMTIDHNTLLDSTQKLPLAGFWIHALRHGASPHIGRAERGAAPKSAPATRA